MNSSKDFLRIALTLVGIGALVMNSGCKGPDVDIARPTTHAAPVDEVFEAARDYALGTKDMASLKDKYYKLNVDENRELSKKKGDNGDTFAHYLCEAKATDETPKVLNSFLAKLDSLEAQGQVKAMAAGDSCVTILMDPKKRKTGEDDNARIQEIAAVLPYDPNGVNDFRTADGKFNAADFNRTVIALKQAGTASQVVKELKPDHLESWLTHRPIVKETFGELYPTVASSAKARMRNELLAVAYKEGLVQLKEFLTNLEAYGLLSELNTDDDAYTLASGADSATMLKGSLLHVLALRLKNDSALGDAAPIGLNNLRSFSSELKTKLGPAYTDYATKRLSEGATTLAALGANAPAKLLLSLAAEAGTIQEVMDEAAHLAQVPTEDQSVFQELFDSTIANETSATALSKLISVTDRFIHKLARMKASEKSSAILRKYLDLLGAGASTVVSELSSGQSALKILSDSARPVPAGEEIADRKLMILNLVKVAAPTEITSINKPQDFKNLLTAVWDLGDQADLNKIFRNANAQVFSTLAEFSFPHLATDKIKEAFKAAYDLPASQKELRSALLQYAYKKDPATPVAEVKKLIVSADALGLKAGLHSDIYELQKNGAGPKFSGTMLMVLTQRAKEANTPAAYAQLRELALALKTAIPGTYEATANLVLPVLVPAVAKGFAPYYLALESLTGLMAAAEDRAGVSNAALADLFDLNYGLAPIALGGFDNLAKLSATTADKFIHLLARRDIDDKIFGLIDRYLTAFSDANQKVQVIAPTAANANALSLLLDVRTTPDRRLADVARKLIGIDDGKGLSILNNAQVKQLLKVLPSNADFTAIYAKAPGPIQKALRSELLERAVASGKILDFITISGDAGNKLGAGFNTDVYDLDGRSGSLLYVLAAKAAAVLPIPNFNELRIYAQALKVVLDTQLAGRYAANVKTTIPPAPRSPFAEVERAFPGAGKAQAAYYLALDDKQQLKELMEAAADRVGVTEAELKAAYDLLITTDALAAELAKEPPIGGDKFIHLLARRVANPISLAIFTAFRNGVANAAGGLASLAGIAAVNDLFDQQGNGNERPITILLTPTLATVPATDVSLFQIIALAIAGTSNATFNDATVINQAQMRRIAIRAFGNKGTTGRAVFKEAYTTKASATNQGYLRNMLLASAQANAATRVADTNDMIAPANEWGLSPTVATDPYILGAIGPAPLLTVLTNKAIADEPIGGTQALKIASYDLLRDYATQIKATLTPNLYVQHAVGNANPVAAVTAGSPLALLQAHFDAAPRNWPGLAELVLDVFAPGVVVHGVDEALVRRATLTNQSEITLGTAGTSRLPNAKLKDLYNAIITTPMMARNLRILPAAPHSGVAGPDLFFSGLVRRPIDADLWIIIKKFLNLPPGVTGLTPVQAGRQLEYRGHDNQNPLQILTNPGRPGVIITFAALGTEDAAEVKKTVNALLDFVVLGALPLVNNNPFTPITNPADATALLDQIDVAKRANTLPKVIAWARPQVMDSIMTWLANPAKAIPAAVFQAAFKAGYAAVAASPAQRLALRSALLQNRYDPANEPILKAFIDQITDPTVLNATTDPWGLRAELDVDNYQLPDHVGGVVKLEGSLLYVLAKRIHEGHVATLAPAVYGIAYANLRTYALRIKELFAAAAKDYVAFAAKPSVAPLPPETAIAALTIGAGALIPRLAKFYLDLPATVTAQEVFEEAAALADPANLLSGGATLNGPTARLTWLYKAWVTDAGANADANANTLANLYAPGLGGAATMFIHNLVLPEAKDVRLAILRNILKRVHDRAAATGADGILAKANLVRFMSALPGNPTALEILVGPRAATAAAEALDPQWRDVMISELVRANVDAVPGANNPITSIQPAEVATLLNAIVKQGKTEDLVKALRGLTDLGVVEAARWLPSQLGKNIWNIANSAETSIAAHMLAERAARGPAVQTGMDNAFVAGAYALGHDDATIVTRPEKAKAGLKEVAKNLASPYIQDAVRLTANTYDPWTGGASSPGGDSTLLYAVLFKARVDASPAAGFGPDNITRAMVFDLADAMKNRLEAIQPGVNWLTTAWQAYVDTKNSHGGQSIVDLVQTFDIPAAAVGPATPLSIARDWLAW